MTARKKKPEVQEPLKSLLDDYLRRPGLSGIAVYDDGFEVCGSPEDSDTSVGWISWAGVTPEQVRDLVGPHFPISDERSKA